MKHRINWYIPALLLLATNLKAQDPTFTQFNSVPLYFNPGFAGSIEQSRLALAYRNQWSSIYQTFYLSYDQAISRIHGGAGIILNQDNSGGILNVFYCGLVYAPKFNIRGKLSISPAIKIGYRRQTIDLSKLTFGDMIDPRQGFTNLTNESLVNSRNNIDMNAGVVINTESYYIGIAADHINQPNTSFIKEGKSKLPVKYIAQLGYIYQKNDDSNFSFSPNILFQRHGDEQLIQANLSFRYKYAIVGIGFTNTSYAAMLGYYSKRFVIGYSYQYFPEPALDSKKISTAHEVAIKYHFTLKRKKKEN